jgi:hypothetical protein
MKMTEMNEIFLDNKHFAMDAPPVSFQSFYYKNTVEKIDVPSSLCPKTTIFIKDFKLLYLIF